MDRAALVEELVVASEAALEAHTELEVASAVE